jgi:succinyl-diaminopimelate desuccinylase
METTNWLLEDMDTRRDELFALAEELIAAPSQNPPGIVTDAAVVAQRYLTRCGIPHDIFTPAPGRENVVARIETGVPGPHILLNAHLDVFPFEILDDDDPVEPASPRDEAPWRPRIAGRGAVDMKGGATAFMFVAGSLNRIKSSLSGSVTLILVCDEETAGPFGSKYLVEHHPEVLADVVLSSEPSSPGLVRYGEKGLNIGKAFFIGPTGHGAYPNVQPNPIVQAAAFVRDLEDVVATFPVPPQAIDPDYDRRFDAALGDGSSDALRSIVLNIGRIEGGVKHNMKPKRCTVDVDIRTPIGVDSQALVEAVCATAAKHGGEYREVESGDANVSETDLPLFHALRSAVATVTNREPMLSVGLGATDCRLWRRRGIPAAVYGPDPSTMATDDEYVDADELLNVAKVHALTCLTLLAPIA